MPRRTHELGRRDESYARTCVTLEKMGRRVGISAARGSARSKREAPSGRRRTLMRSLETDMDRAGIGCEPQVIIAAGKTLAGMAAAVSLSAFYASLVMAVQTAQAATLILALACPWLCYRWIVSYPSSAARRRASDILRTSAEAANLMVMSVRQDSSLPRAIAFASGEGHGFSRELRRCTWEVVMGTHKTFEDALHALGCRWEGFSSELKTALNALVTASCEATEDGKRRALDRANAAMVSGTKRRVEEYALSLSTPSMLLFGLGILLPIMVAAFLPILSWDIWSGPAAEGAAAGQADVLVQIAIVMNIVFPATAFLVAVDAVSRRPVDRRGPGSSRGIARGPWPLALASGAICGSAAYWLLVPDPLTPLVLLAGVAPASTVLMVSGRSTRRCLAEDEVQDILFRTGSRMLEGDNFESALHRASSDGAGHSLGKGLCLKAFAMGRGFDASVESEAGGASGNALQALKVVRKASTKDEGAAGLLAMDIASYLRDLAEIETALKMRLRPTISMMRMTAHFLGPLVLGITFAIHLSLASIAGGEGADGTSSAMLLVLGLFLAEMNVVVCYFVWGIEGGLDPNGLARSTGTCLLVSQLVFVSTALLVG